MLVLSLLVLCLGMIFSGSLPAQEPASSPIKIETKWLDHKKTVRGCVEAAKAAFRDNYYPDPNPQGPSGVYAGDDEKTFVIRCDHRRVSVCGRSLHKDGVS